MMEDNRADRRGWEEGEGPKKMTIGFLSPSLLTRSFLSTHSHHSPLCSSSFHPWNRRRNVRELTQRVAVTDRYCGWAPQFSSLENSNFFVLGMISSAFALKLLILCISFSTVHRCISFKLLQLFGLKRSVICFTHPCDSNATEHNYFGAFEAAFFPTELCDIIVILNLHWPNTSLMRQSVAVLPWPPQLHWT